MKLKLIICHKNELLSSVSSIKLVLIRNKCYQCKLVGTGTMNEWCKIEMATAQRTRPRAVVGAPRRVAWQLKSALRHSVSAAPRTIFFYIFLELLLVIFSL